MVVNLMTMPLAFMSGAFHPATTMPDQMKWIAKINPLTYSVHAVRYWLANLNTEFEYMNPLTDLAILTAFTTSMLTTAMMAFKKAALEDQLSKVMQLDHSKTFKAQQISSKLHDIHAEH